MALYRILAKALVAVLVCIPARVYAHEPAAALPGFDLDTPPGKLVDIGGYRLQLYCRGSGSPTVVFDAGLGGFSMDWLFVQQELPGDFRSCSYDRAGYGWSDAGPAPRATDQISAELERLLSAAAIAPPYILVGHSFGAFNVEYFAATHPDAVAGLVLVEASHPDQAERLPDLPARTAQSSRGTLVTFFDPAILYRSFPERLWHVMGALLVSPKAIATQQRELVNFNVSAAQVKSAGALPHVPLVVISRGQRAWPRTPLGNALEKAWFEMQAEIAASVPGGRHVFAAHSGHQVNLDEPDIVAREIDAMVGRVRGRHVVPAAR